MEILQPYNNTTLQLISDQDNINLILTINRWCNKLSVFSDVGSYLDGEDLQQDIDFYVKNDEFLLNQMSI